MRRFFTCLAGAVTTLTFLFRPRLAAASCVTCSARLLVLVSPELPAPAPLVLKGDFLDPPLFLLADLEAKGKGDLLTE